MIAGRSFLLSLLIIMFYATVGNAADVTRMKVFILNNISYNTYNPIFKDEDIRHMKGFRSVLMNSPKVKVKNMRNSILQDLYGSFAMDFSDSNEARRGHCQTALHFAKLAILARAEDTAGFSPRPSRLIDHAKYALSSAAEPNSLSQQYVALLALEYYLTNKFDIEEINKYLPGLDNDKQKEFREIFRAEIAGGQSNKKRKRMRQ
jgi:hypothetical protein